MKLAQTSVTFATSFPTRLIMNSLSRNLERQMHRDVNGYGTGDDIVKSYQSISQVHRKK